jgi:hypothetical protein
MASKSIGVRIPDEINERFEEYGREHFPKGDGFDKTRTVLDLICKGLGLPRSEEKAGQDAINVERLVKQIVEREIEIAIASLRNDLEGVTATVTSLTDEVEMLKLVITDRDENAEEDSPVEGMSRSTLAPIFEDF